MKKTLLIALAGLMLFSFTQCNNKDGKNKDDEKTSKSKKNKNNDDEQYEDESREYKDFMKAAKEAESTLKRATCCEDLEKAEDDFMNSEWAQRTDNDYSFEETMTRAEKEEMEERMNEISDLYDKLMDDFGCWGGYGYDDDDDYWSYDDDTTGTSGGSDFRSTKNAIEEAMRSMRNARTCDDLDNALFALIFLDPDFDHMTSYEEEEIDKLAEQLGEIYEQQTQRLGCQDDDDDDDW